MASIREGCLVDARDTEFIWCRATIRKILFDDGSQHKEYLVHYEGWNKVYDEIISHDSVRLAPYGYFSSRSDIPRYSLTQPEDNLRSRIDYPTDRQDPWFIMLGFPRQ